MSEDIYTVRLSFKNYEFEVTVDAETYTKIQTDNIYKEDFARQTYESLENDGHFISDSRVEENEDIKPIIGFKWTKPAIDQLINIRFSRNNEFNSPKLRKSELWQSVAKTISLSFPGVTGEMCDAKYRNLLHTYKLNKQKQHRLGPDCVKWEYFDQFESNLGLQLSSHRETSVFDSMLSEKTGKFCKEDLLFIEDSPGSPDSCSESPKQKLTKLDITLAQYLKFKVENDIKNTKLKEKIWKEKKQMKQREIAAILQLAKALKNKK